MGTSGRNALLLPLDPLSVRRARHHVTGLLVEAGREGWAADAGLAVTELVANVVLHARTACEVSVEISEVDVRVGVRDFSPSPPVHRHFSQQATTGRGLSVVAHVSADFGIDLLGVDGKVVWFVVDGTAGAQEPGDAAGEWDLSGVVDDDVAEPLAPAAVLQHVPLALWLAGMEHQTAMLRELHLLLAGGTEHELDASTIDLDAAGVALRLLARATDRAVTEVESKPWLPRLAALPDGHPALSPQLPAVYDIEVAVGAAGTEPFGAFQDALDQGAVLAHAGRLLVRPALDDVVAVRDWACDQVVAQQAGVAPAPWDDTAVARLSSRRARDLVTDWDDTLVRTSDRAVLAADDSNRLIAVSPAAAELLCGTSEELVGQRITTVIPPRLRQQHVAGFTRHLTTGQARALGVPLTLPVLSLDGREIMCGFFIEQVPAPAGRHVYIAWLDPRADEA